MKYHRLCGLSNKHLFLVVLEAISPRSRCQHRRVCGEGSLSGFVFKRSFLVQACRWTLYFLLLLEEHQSHHGGFTFMTSSKLNYFPMALHPNIITWVIRASTYKFEAGYKHSVPSRHKQYVKKGLEG